MGKYRDNLPHLGGDIFLTDGGLETTLIFHEGLELPEFAAFDLLKDAAGTAALRSYYQPYIALAHKYAAGLILESATWRASADWADKLGYSAAELADMNERAIAMLQGIRAESETLSTPMVISGCVGPRGDGYVPAALMSAAEAEQYHAVQIAVFRAAGADMVTAVTMNYVEEAIGITRAAQRAGMPVAISFTVETNGRLPTGQSLQAAIEQTDAATGSGPLYYMINCAHPEHFAPSLSGSAPWLARIGGLRANASAKSHAELNESTEIDIGNPLELGRQHRALMSKLPNLRVLGGCCGTDHRHVEAIYEACVAVV